MRQHNFFYTLLLTLCPRTTITILLSASICFAYSCTIAHASRHACHDLSALIAFFFSILHTRPRLPLSCRSFRRCTWLSRLAGLEDALPRTTNPTTPQRLPRLYSFPTSRRIVLHPHNGKVSRTRYIASRQRLALDQPLHQLAVGVLQRQRIPFRSRGVRSQERKWPPRWPRNL